MKKISKQFLLVCASCLAGCSPSKPAALSYKIERDGAPVESGKTEFSYSETVSFILTQKYNIKPIGNEKIGNHFLVANVIKKIGKKIDSDEKGILIPVLDGVASFDCTNYYSSVKSSEVDKVDDPVCEFSPVGYLELTGGARAEVVK